MANLNYNRVQKDHSAAYEDKALEIVATTALRGGRKIEPVFYDVWSVVSNKWIQVTPEDFRKFSNKELRMRA